MMSKTGKKDKQPVIIEKSDSTILQVKSSAIRPVDFSTGTNIVIRVEDLWKEYRLGTINHGTLTKDLQSWWARMRGKEDPNLRIDQSVNVSNDSTDVVQDRFWALKDISFEVKQGEVLGIIGGNGAGKSTLLKILSRVTTPTSGVVRVKGRIASLLEIGTGFHPELTGRENIFLNGAILGMSKPEIRCKFDEIVDFSEIEKFIDTPVKRYSSGMYVRLAFAVAAHLESEILLVDEVLAVGDAQFQKKCLGKMGEVGKEGRTVLFVSHNIQAIKQLCHRAVLIESGHKIADGQSPEVITKYLQRMTDINDGESLQSIIDALPSDPVFRLESVTLRQQNKKVEEYVENGHPLEVEIGYQVMKKTQGLRVYFDLCDDQDTLLFRSFHDEDNDGIPTVTPGRYTSTAMIPANILGPTRYELRVRAGIHNVRSFLPAMGIQIPLNIVNTGTYNNAYMGDTFRGKLAMSIDWTSEVTR